MMTFKELREEIAQVNEEALLADGYEDALIGYVERFGQEPVALYDREKCIAILMKRDKMDFDGAVEFFEFNTLGAGVGENGPAFATVYTRTSKGKRKGEPHPGCEPGRGKKEDC
jgi:hypothetical protein